MSPSASDSAFGFDALPPSGFGEAGEAGELDVGGVSDRRQDGLRTGDRRSVDRPADSAGGSGARSAPGEPTRPAKPTEQPMLPGETQPLVGGHPMDSSRILLAMTALARRAQETRAQQVSGGQPADDISTIIAPPVLRTLLSAIHYRDPEVLAHSRRVAKLAVGMAQHLGWEGRSLRSLEIAALLHDVGKIGVADNVLHKPGRLAPNEAEYVERHENIALNILQALRVDHAVVELVQQSHGDFNAALAEGQRSRHDVRQGARVLAVADAYDSLVHAQSFRAAMTHDQAMQILNEGAGSRFDGNVVAALDGWIGVEGVDFLTGTADARVAANLQTMPGVRGLTTEAVAAQEASTLCQIISYLYVLETLYDGFYVLDSDLRCVVWSPGAERLTGRPAKTMLGQSYSRGLYGQADPAATPLAESECPVRQATATGHAALRTLKIAGRDGEAHVIELQSIPLMDSDGRLQGVAQIIRDTEAEQESGQYKELKAAARQDALTKVANRGELERQMRELVDQFRAEHDRNGHAQPLSVVFTDLDKFKTVNDTHGHAVGDEVLVRFAQTLQKEVYSGELVARYGGEEFVLLCPGTNKAGMVERADRIRQVVSKLKFEEIPSLALTSSFGVSELHPGDSIETVFKRADDALMQAKQTGRNRVVTSDGPGDLIPAAKMPATRSDDGRLYRDRMEVCTQSNLIQIKLKGFVLDVGAQLRSVSAEKVVMRLGTVGLTRRWGKADDRQAVELTLHIGADREARGSAKYVPIDLEITPLGKPQSTEQFLERSQRVSRDLRAYLVAK